MSKRISLGVALGAVLALVGGVLNGSAGDLTLHPSGFGPHSYAAWKAQQGNPADADGATSNQALYFQKMAPTATFAAGVAVVNGVAGMPASELTGLSWEHRTDGHCGAGAPRWNIGVDGSDGVHYTLFLGCSAATHTAVSTSWCQDSYAGTDILSVGASNAGFGANLTAITAIEAGTLTSLALVFDEGTDSPGNPVCGQPGGAAGFVFLDNVTVNETTWSSASDNSNG
jgi:hypothetical protein